MIAKLTDGAVNLCTSSNTSSEQSNIENVEIHKFAGPHPAGLAGTHIHYIDPVSVNKTVWTIGYQDVIAIGALFTTGHLDNSRVVALAGPQVHEPDYCELNLS